MDQKTNGKRTHSYASICISVKCVWSAATKLNQYLHKKKLQELLLLGLSLVNNVMNIVLLLLKNYYSPFLIVVK